MPNKIVYLAVAGAGKTYSICHNLDLTKRSLILSFTNENILNLSREVINNFGYIPDNIKIMTFDSFKLNYFIWPFISRIKMDFFKMPITNNHYISLIKERYNPEKKYKESKSNKLHYFIRNGNDYLLKLDKVSELILYHEFKFLNSKTLFEVGIDRVNYFYDNIYIDEFQDYRESNYDLICTIAKNVNNIFLYGDYYQHSVSGQNNSGKPFSKSTLIKFKKEIKKQGFNIDEETLNKTRRCSKEVCEFVRENLNINIYHDQQMGRIGVVQYIFNPMQLKSILIDEDSKVIVREKNVYSKGITFGLAKGNTYNSVIVVLPKKAIKNKKICIEDIAESTLNKIYVGITRSTGNVYLTDEKTIKQLE